MRRILYVYLIVLLALTTSACQPIVVQPPGGAEMTEVPQSLSGNFDFTMPDWGLTHGWVQYDVMLPEVEGETPTGWVRWVEVNDDLAVRYMIADPMCVSFGPDGEAALMAVQITEHWGWGEGDPGQWMMFWLNGADNEFASPLWPPADESPGCAYAVPESTIPAMAGSVIDGK